MPAKVSVMTPLAVSGVDRNDCPVFSRSRSPLTRPSTTPAASSEYTAPTPNSFTNELPDARPDRFRGVGLAFDAWRGGRGPGDEVVYRLDHRLRRVDELPVVRGDPGDEDEYEQRRLEREQSVLGDLMLGTEQPEQVLCDGDPAEQDQDV